MSEFEKLVSGTYLEGLAVDQKRDIIWYSDVIGGGVHGLMKDGTVESFNIDRLWTGGIALNYDGSVLSTGGGGIMWNNPETGKSGWLLDKIDGKPINGINEMVPDGEGGLYFGTCDIENISHSEPPRPVAIYRLTAQGEVILLADNIGFCNGIMLNSKRDKLYCNNSFLCTYAFDVLPNGTLANKQVLIEKEDCDGMAVDAADNVWITGFRSSHITRVTPDGRELTPIDTPAGAITQVRFGGGDMRDLYITTVPIDGGDNIKEGVAFTEQNSFLYRGRAEIAGLPIAPTRFKLG